MAQSYFDNMVSKDTHTIKTINTKLGYLKSVSSYICDNRTILNLPDYVSPFFRVNIASFSTYLEPEKVPSLSVIDKLLTTCRQQRDEQLYLIISLVVRCSLTASQVCSLKTSMIRVDNEDNCCICYPGKTTDTLQRVPPDVAKLLFSYMNSRGNTEFLFYSNGTAFYSKLLQRKMKSLSDAAGLENTVTLQDLRNSSIALMLNAGAPAEEVSEYSSIAPRWLYRFNTVVESMQTAACDYVNFSINEF